MDVAPVSYFRDEKLHVGIIDSLSIMRLLNLMTRRSGLFCSEGNFIFNVAEDAALDHVDRTSPSSYIICVLFSAF